MTEGPRDLPGAFVVFRADRDNPGWVSLLARADVRDRTLDDMTPTLRTSALVTRFATVAVVSIAYWSLLGWDTEYYTGADGQLHGPYTTAQVAGFVVVLLALAVWIGFRQDVLASSAAAAGAAAINFGITATVVTPDDTGTWGAGAIFLAIGVFVGGVAVGFPAQAVSHWVRRRAA